MRGGLEVEGVPLNKAWLAFVWRRGFDIIKAFVFERFVPLGFECIEFISIKRTGLRFLFVQAATPRWWSVQSLLLLIFLVWPFVRP